MKNILLFGAGKSATSLIDYLVVETALRNWELTVADGNQDLLRSKTGTHPQVHAVHLQIENEKERKALVDRADIVISLLPPALHFIVAKDCLEFGRSLLTASYTEERIKQMESEIREKGLLFLCEMGLDPGIDHMSAMELIHRIKNNNGSIHSFKSHTGGLISPESDDNPWHYKISWNPRNVVTAGTAGAVYKENDQIKIKEYHELFDTVDTVKLPGLNPLAYYPNRDSLAYIPIYQLQEAGTFIRTTLRYPDFCKYWKCIVQAGLTDDLKQINSMGLTFRAWSSSLQPFITEKNKPAYEFLGLFDDASVPDTAHTHADILQYLLETKLLMQPADRDMIVMLHELEYTSAGQKHAVRSSLVVKGKNSVRTAMAQTVGLPLGIAAVLILTGKIQLTGLHIPIVPEIYGPVLKGLEEYGIAFSEAIS